MTLILNGTTGVSGVDGSAATPAFQGNDANTGISFGTDTVTINTGGTARVTTDASGNVGIGTSSPATYGKLAIGLPASAGTNNVFGVYQSSGVDGAALRFAGYNYANNVQTAIDFVQNSASNFQSQITFNTNNGSGLGEKMRIDSSGNVGIGTVTPTTAQSPGGKAFVLNGGGDQARIGLKNTSTGDAAGDGFQIGIDAAGEGLIDQRENLPIRFTTNAVERMRINSDGNFLIGSTSQLVGGANHRMTLTYPGGGALYGLGIRALADNTVAVNFANAANAQVGNIYTTGSATSYNTNSDYRLKENVAPMQNALATVAALKPVTYTWKASGEAGQGFIAHELQAVVPDCVTGIKDAVDKDGNPQYQGVDTSFLVATLVAAIQELKNEVDALKGAQNV